MDSGQRSRCNEVQAAWEKIRATFELLPSRGEEQARVPTLSEFTADLAAIFTPYFGQQEVAERLVVPEEYHCFLTLSRGTWLRGDEEFGLYLYDANEALSSARYSCSHYAEQRPQNAGLWLEIGHWSERHDIMLCCDRRLPLLGAVVDWNDDHPWLADGDFNALGQPPYVVGANFLEYLQTLDEEEE